MKEYCLGFVFVGNKNILLQRKNRGGEYLEGKLNGLGGKLEKDETPKQAMLREYYEETGDIRVMKWQAAGMLTDNKTYKVHVFFTKVVEYFYDGHTFVSEDENFEELSIIDKHAIDWADSVDNLEMIMENLNYGE